MQSRKSFLQKVNKIIHVAKAFESDKMKKMKKVLQIEVMTKMINSAFRRGDLSRRIANLY